MALPAPVTSPPTDYLTFVPPPESAPEPLSIQTRALTKRYDHIVAVDNLDLRVRRGEVYGFLGPNGAGKTTTLRMLLGLIAPTSGHISMMGMEPGTPGSLARIGAMIETRPSTRSFPGGTTSTCWPPTPAPPGAGSMRSSNRWISPTGRAMPSRATRSA